MRRLEPISEATQHGEHQMRQVSGNQLNQLVARYLTDTRSTD
ncbi:hypothetical protein ADIMK_3545 [Marinobacterium lacunae]|uniref:Uncharacterized protein n=1 Tax=Marinobacterium lacunae TaxID=1232683 RepID=A0A081FUQ0_9GAMM|nr:hypothetical protein ADIMK_3545 [Marinobacterium lacunae]